MESVPDLGKPGLTSNRPADQDARPRPGQAALGLGVPATPFSAGPEGEAGRREARHRRTDACLSFASFPDRGLPRHAQDEQAQVFVAAANRSKIQSQRTITSVLSKASTLGDPLHKNKPTIKTALSPNSLSQSAARIGIVGSFLNEASPRKSRFSIQQATALASASNVTTPTVKKELKKQSSFGASFRAKPNRSTSIAPTFSPQASLDPKKPFPALPALHRKPFVVVPSDPGAAFGLLAAKR